MKPDTTDSSDGAAAPRRSIVDVWTEVAADAGGLIRAEAALARLETGQNLRHAGVQSLKLLAGAVLLAVALVFLAVALVVALSLWIGLVAALLAVAAVSVLMGLVMFVMG